jgi:hypothetical protein
MEFIEKQKKTESPDNDTQPEIAKLWENKVSILNYKLYKKSINQNQHLRSEAIFNKNYKLEKIAKVCFGIDCRKDWDKNLETVEEVPLIEGAECCKL